MPSPSRPFTPSNFAETAKFDRLPGRAMTKARALLIVPLAVFVGVVVLLYSGFGLGRADLLPSALVDKPFPAFSLPTLKGEPANRSRDDLLGKVRLVNVWATWCPTCAAEHDELARIASETGIGVVGVNYKDDPNAARAWLAERGDPYLFHVVDSSGDLGVDLGVYGAPETFVVDAEGIIRFKQVGAVTAETWRDSMAPVVASLVQASIKSAGATHPPPKNPAVSSPPRQGKSDAGRMDPSSQSSPSRGGVEEGASPLRWGVGRARKSGQSLPKDWQR